jgi:glycosyltransferase involved in cell wall biosynthesis
VFLDADDRLLPEALEAGLQCFEDHPECAFVYGHYRFIAADGSFLRQTQQLCVDKDHYPAMVERDYIRQPAAVMYRRSVFETIGGFDTSNNACADWDHYLRVVRKFPIYYHKKTVVEYRMHDTNMSSDFARMLRSSMDVLRSQWKYVRGNEQYEQAYKAGKGVLRQAFGTPLPYKIRDHMRKREWKQAIGDILILLKYYPNGINRSLELLHALYSKQHRVAMRLRLLREQLQNRTKQLEASEQRLQNRTKQLETSEQRLQNRIKQLQRLEEQNQSLAQRLQNLEQQMQK